MNAVYIRQYPIIHAQTPYNRRAINHGYPLPLIMAVKMQGSVSAVEAAVEAAAEAAEKVSGLICKHVIPRPTDDAMKMAKRVSVGKHKVGHIPMNG